MGRFSHFPSRPVVRRAGALAAVAVTAGSMATAFAPTAGAVRVAEKVTIGKATTLTVSYRGNGHGHGMSQYGARGAARAGLTYKQILAFYYPGTKLVTLPKKRIKVKLAGTGSTTTIAARDHTTVTGVKGYLPTTGVRKYRLVAGSGTTLTLQKLGTAAGSKWTTVRSGLPNRSEFHRNSKLTRVYESDGQSTDYYGFIRAVRAPGGGVFTVDRAMLDNYVAGVVPREMPAGWERQALDAQAVAARTYAANALAGSGNADYDICATTMCQVYGGQNHYDTDGTLEWSAFPPAAHDTSYKILTYGGKPAFAQFSASNGGWTVTGGQPYLVAKSDPYDTPARSFDPYIGASKSVKVSTVARYFHLAKLTAITITARDGHGTWKGRVLAGTVTGTDAKGKAKSISVDGYDLQSVFGLGTTWLKVAAAAH
jgi:SpoIID/LytB domain protein